jgi:paraquat-inducible protein B
MNEMIAAARPASEPPPAAEPPDAAVSKRRGISIVWLIPLVAALIAGFIGYRAITSQGPTITITFETAEGLQAGKTKVRYLDVDVGTVETVAIGADLKHIVVTASMVPEARAYLRESTTFWIVKPRVGVGGVSGLSTLLSGAYIGLAPGDGADARRFAGLEEPPQLSANVAGRRYTLRAPTLGSVSRGAPIYYRGIEVGQVLGYSLTPDARALDVTIFVEEPYHELVRTTSRFWNASGINLTTSAAGISLNVASLQALLVGGIEFDTLPSSAPSEVAQAGMQFELFASQAAIAQAQFTEKIPFLVHFDGSVRGLHPGAPVEFRGMKVGEVTEVRLELDERTQRVRIPVTLALEPQRFLGEMGAQQIRAGAAADYPILRKLIADGMRAQLATGNLLTGELFVDLTLVPNAPPAELDTKGPLPVIPSVPNTLDQLQASATEILNKIASLPLNELVANLTKTADGLQQIVNSPDVQQAMRSLTGSMAQLQQTLGRIDSDAGPLLASLKGTADAASATLRQAQTTLTSTQRTIGPDSILSDNLEGMMQELTRAARSIRVFADYLERHPEALIRGKTGAAGR